MALDKSESFVLLRRVPLRSQLDACINDYFS